MNSHCVLQQRSSQKSCHRLEEHLLSSQHESERLQEELKLVVQQLDTNIRYYSSMGGHSV